VVFKAAKTGARSDLSPAVELKITKVVLLAKPDVMAAICISLISSSSEPTICSFGWSACKSKVLENNA
jgi:hypothetical protein